MPKDYWTSVIAENYDTDAGVFDPAVVTPTVRFLAGLATGGAALELAVGTGRIALPLSRLGVRVHGIDLSPDMVEQLRKKPGAEDVETTIGDICSAQVEGKFRLAYLVYNGIENLTTQDEQVACFCNAARHLESGGCFVIEVEVPQLRRLPPGERVRAFAVSATHVGVDELDPVDQTGISHHYWLDGARGGLWSMPYRYVWPSELDLMARIAGLRLRERWGGWQGEPFSAESRMHVSVWEKP